MQEKFFTVEEAEQLIPKLEQIVESLIENKKNAMDIGQDLARMEEKLRSSTPHGIEPTEYMNKRTEMEFLVRIINEGLGIDRRHGSPTKRSGYGLGRFSCDPQRGRSFALLEIWGEVDSFLSRSQGRFHEPKADCKGIELSIPLGNHLAFQPFFFVATKNKLR